jgi:fibronectin-binding autotransporter adhesin
MNATAIRILFVASVLSVTTRADTLYWDHYNNTGLGASGDWVSNNRWNSNAAGTNAGRTNWFDGSDAIFSGVSGIVNVNSSVLVNSITFESSGYSITGSSAVTLGSSMTRIDTGANSAIISATFAGSNGLEKAGSGTLSLTGTNTYTGATLISAGTLSISNSLASSSLTLGGGTLQLGGALNQSFKSTGLTLLGSSTIDFGSGVGGSTISFGTTLAESWTGTLNIANFGAGDHLYFGLDSTSLVGKISFDGNFDVVFNPLTGEITAVPEPATFALGLGAVALLFAVGRKRNWRPAEVRSRKRAPVEIG